MGKYSLKAWIALVLICTIWGTTYFFLKIGVGEMAPFLFSAIRQTAAGLILFLVLCCFGQFHKLSKKTILLNSLAGFLMITLGNGLVAYGELSIPSSMAAVICSSLPIWVALLTAYMPSGYRLSRLGIFAVIIGLIGILGLFSDSLAQFTDLNYIGGAVLTLVATFCWIAGTYVIKKQNETVNPFLIASIQMFAGGLGLFLISFIFEQNAAITLSTNGWLSLIYLTIFGSIIAMGAYSLALKEMPIQIVSVYAYINPVVAIILGWIFLNEKMTLTTLISCIIIITSVILLNFSRKRTTASSD